MKNSNTLKFNNHNLNFNQNLIHEYEDYDQTKHTIQRYFTILTMSVPNVINNKTGFKSSITSSVTTDKFSVGSDKILERMEFLNFKKFKVFLITEGVTSPMLYEFFHPENYILSKYSVLLINRNLFFTLECFEHLIDENKEDSFENIFVFDGISWKELCAQFALISIDISGGSNTKKHLLSNLQFKLALFLSCIYDGSEASTIIKKSFHRDFNAEDKKRFNYSTKGNQDKIINFVSSDAQFRSRVLDEYLNSVKSKNNFSSSPLKTTPLKTTPLKTKEATPNKKKNNINDTNKTPLSSINTSNNSNTGNRKYHTSPLRASCLFLKKRFYSTLSKETRSLPSIDKSSIGLYFKSIKELIDGTIDLDENKKYEIQQKLEENWIELIKDKFKDDNIFVKTHPDKVILSIKSCKETLNIMEENKYLEKKFTIIGVKLNNFDYIILTLSLCLSLYSRLNYNNLALKIGGEILFYMWKKEINWDQKKDLTFIEWKKSININTINTLKLGDFFMTLLQTYPHDLFHRTIKINSYYTNEPSILNINNDYLEDIKKNIIINPITIPMICIPKNWTENVYGGFLSNEIIESDIITGINNHHHKIENKNLIYKAVNYLNSIKFGINRLLLNYITSKEGKYILELVKPDDELQRVITLEVAELYSNIPFYLNTHADWRGRIYTQSFFISYQSGDLSLSLLNFWEGEKLNEEGKFYLYIYGANSHNQNKISKASFKDRINWVNLNYYKIINLDKELILSAESPFIFTAFCLNMKELHNNPNTIIKTPVFLDATCSGIQHLAALMKDLELGTNTNLIESTMDEKPGDIYETLLEPINKAINVFGEENIQYSMLSLVKLTRKEVKTPIMTKVYNVTKYGISNQLQSILKSNNEKEFENEFYNKPIKDIHKDILGSVKSNKSKTKYYCPSKDGKNILISSGEIYKIASIINEQIFVVFPSLNKIYNYFIELTNLAVKLELPVTWITPSGLKITQNYFKKKKKVISISIFGKTKKVVIKENLNKLDKGKQIQAIIPNIIHSLDASHLLNILKNAIQDNFNPVITIHDCFGTLPSQMGSLEFRVKKEFIILYSNDQFLDEYHKRFIQNLNDNRFEITNIDDKSFVLLEDRLLEIPSVPQLGKLELEKIIKSKYMIS